MLNYLRLLSSFGLWIYHARIAKTGLDHRRFCHHSSNYAWEILNFEKNCQKCLYSLYNNWLETIYRAFRIG